MDTTDLTPEAHDAVLKLVRLLGRQAAREWVEHGSRAASTQRGLHSEATETARAELDA